MFTGTGWTGHESLEKPRGIQGCQEGLPGCVIHMRSAHVRGDRARLDMPPSSAHSPSGLASSLGRPRPRCVPAALSERLRGRTASERGSDKPPPSRLWTAAGVHPAIAPWALRRSSWGKSQGRARAAVAGDLLSTEAAKATGRPAGQRLHRGRLAQHLGVKQYFPGSRTRKWRV